MRRDRTRLGQDLAALDLVPLGAAQQHPDIVPRLALVEQLAEHLNARARRLHRLLQAHDLDLVAHLHNTALDTARHHRAPARDREHILDRHQERQVHRTLRLRDILVHRRHQLQDLVLADAVVAALPAPPAPSPSPPEGRRPETRSSTAAPGPRARQAPEASSSSTWSTLFRYHHDRRHPDLARQQDMLARLRHRAVRCRNHKDRAVHLRRTRDHVPSHSRHGPDNRHGHSGGSTSRTRHAPSQSLSRARAPPAPCRSDRTTPPRRRPTFSDITFVIAAVSVVLP